MADLTMQKLQELKTEKQTAHTKSLAYYDSTQSPVYLSRRMRAFFTSNPHYKQNWVATVVDAVRSKLIVEGYNVGEETTDTDGVVQPDPRQEILNEFWDTGRMSVEADMIHEYCHAVGEAFLVAGVNSNGIAVGYAVDPRSVVIYYGGEDPRVITQAAYFWLDGEVNMATVWTVDDSGKVYEETLEAQRRTSMTETPATQNQLAYVSQGAPAPTNFPRIPVFHFRRSSRNIKPEFYQVQDLQDMINKTFVAQGFAIENAADNARVVITSGEVEELAGLKAGDVGAIPPAPHGVQPVSIHEFQGADITSLTSVIDSTIIAIASITNTPRHYFKGDGIGVGISGEALQAMEAPLVAKVRRYMRRHAPQWEAFGAFVLTIVGMKTDISEITCNYADPRTILTLSEAQARESNVRAGIPVITQLRSEGWRQSEIDQLLSDREAARELPLDEEAVEKAYDMLASRAEQAIEPMLEQALTFIADAALKKIVEQGAVERIAGAAE
jgi:hypothetical protein